MNQARLSSSTVSGTKATLSRRAGLTLMILTAMLIATHADALPKLGSSRPSTRLVDGWDRELDTSKLERPLLVFYEDKDSGAENQALKDDLIALEKSHHYSQGLAHIVVADLGGYDYWPAKGIAKSELRKWSNRLGIVVYGDFSGEAKKGFAVESGRSNVILYSKEGKVLFASAGALNKEQRATLVELVRTQAHIDTPTLPAAAAADLDQWRSIVN